MRAHRWQPTRLPHPWDSPGKNTGVGCHFLLQRMKVKSEKEVTQLCLTLRDPMDCSPPGSSIHGIFQARVLEWGANAFITRGSVYISLQLSQFVPPLSRHSRETEMFWDCMTAVGYECVLICQIVELRFIPDSVCISPQKKNHIKIVMIKREVERRGLPRWFSGKESTLQCKEAEEMQVRSWVGKIPWKEEMATHSSILGRRILDRGAGYW